MANNNDIESNYQSALHLISSGNFNEAIADLKKCIDEDLQHSDALLLLARLYLEISQLDSALTIYTQAKTIEKFELKAIAGIAKILRIQGNAKAAYQLIQQEIKSHRIHVEIILAFSDICLELKCYSEAIPKIKDLLSNNDIKTIDDKKNLLHTLGKLYDKDKKYKKAFQAHQLANELSNNQYNPQQFQQRISKIQDTYSIDFLKSCNLSTVKSNQPVFIVGMPRSGTTLVEQILSCHSQIHAAGELSTIQQLVARMCKGNFPEQMKKIDTATLNNSANYYINEECSKNHLFTTDKMPHNYLYLGVIHQLFPNSKIININRQPIDNCLSIYFQYFNDSHRYATNLSDIAHHYAGHHTLTNYWKKQFPENIIDIHYEDIVNNTQPEITRILDFLGLSWEVSCLHHDKNKRHVLTASQQQVNKPIYKQSVERWKHYEAFISPLLSDLKKYSLI